MMNIQEQADVFQELFNKRKKLPMDEYRRKLLDLRTKTTIPLGRDMITEELKRLKETPCES